MRAIPCPVSPDVLRRMVEVERLTAKQISERLPNATVKRVQSWKKRFGIASIPRWARNVVPDIEGDLRSLLIGSMLGDGRLVANKAAFYTESHSGAQEEYLRWKASLWGDAWVRDLKEVPDKRGHTQFRMWTVSHLSLVPYRDLFYAHRDRGWKRLVPEVVEHVDPFALAIWYLDDGHAGWWPEITFGACSKSREVAFAIFDRFGLRPRWKQHHGNTGSFYMEREETACRFLSLIGPYVPECMAYKTRGFGFKGKHYRIRNSLTPEVLLERAQAGVPIAHIAREFGVGASTVSRHLKKHGIEHPRKKGCSRA